MQKETGFTLVELMVVIAIVGILLSVGVPSFRYVTTSNRMSTEVNSLLGDLQYARSEAIKEGQTVTVCPSVDFKSCSSTSSWQSGWIVFSNPDNDAAVVDSGEPILRVRAGFAGNDTLLADNSIQYFTFNRDGFAANLQSTPTVTLTLHDQSSTVQWTRCLQVTLVGLLTTQTHATAASCL
jgi:type IV fimbrial biogenesis protein FimT